MYTVGIICDRKMEMDVANLATPIVFPDLTEPLVARGYYVDDNGKRTEHRLDEPLEYCTGSIPFIYNGKLFRGAPAMVEVNVTADMLGAIGC